MADEEAEQARNQSYSDVISRVIADWHKEQSAALTTPLDPGVLGDLSKRITRALVVAGLIDEEL